jgi:hypothetical protein
MTQEAELIKVEDQKIELINVRDLVLWTENPRDPIDPKASDQDIVNRALENNLSKWNLAALSRDMGRIYDFSELPTVVYHEGKPVVYDGNRRIILAKIKLGIVSAPKASKLRLPDVMEIIPCNVCSEAVALYNIERKHSDSGSWKPLERDIFRHKFLKEEKSAFLILEENTNIISNNPHLNQGFVRDELFKEDNLKKLGFVIQNDNLTSRHMDEQAMEILNDLSEKVKGKLINTREYRGKVVDVLNPSSQDLIRDNRNNELRPLRPQNRVMVTTPEKKTKPRQSKRTVKKGDEIFGGKLYLRMGEVSNVYRDITDLYQFYVDNKDKLSKSFPGLVRMSLRLLCDTAASDLGRSLESYVKDHFDSAKSTLSQDVKTTLAAQNINKESIMQLLHTGAHSYQSASNLEQTLALSIIVGAIVTITHGQGLTS